MWGFQNHENKDTSYNLPTAHSIKGTLQLGKEDTQCKV
jgi:hypothetical protein